MQHEDQVSNNSIKFTLESALKIFGFTASESLIQEQVACRYGELLKKYLHSSNQDKEKSKQLIAAHLYLKNYPFSEIIIKKRIKEALEQKHQHIRQSLEELSKLHLSHHASSQKEKRIPRSKKNQAVGQYHQNDKTMLAEKIRKNKQQLVLFEKSQKEILNNALNDVVPEIMNSIKAIFNYFNKIEKTASVMEYYADWIISLLIFYIDSYSMAESNAKKILTYIEQILPFFEKDQLETHFTREAFLFSIALIITLDPSVTRDNSPQLTAWIIDTFYINSNDQFKKLKLTDKQIEIIKCYFKKELALLFASIDMVCLLSELDEAYIIKTIWLPLLSEKKEVEQAILKFSESINSSEQIKIKPNDIKQFQCYPPLASLEVQKLLFDSEDSKFQEILNKNQALNHQFIHEKTVLYYFLMRFLHLTDVLSQCHNELFFYRNEIKQNNGMVLRQRIHLIEQTHNLITHFLFFLSHAMLLKELQFVTINPLIPKEQRGSKNFFMTIARTSFKQRYTEIQQDGDINLDCSDPCRATGMKPIIKLTEIFNTSFTTGYDFFTRQQRKQFSIKIYGEQKIKHHLSFLANDICMINECIFIALSIGIYRGKISTEKNNFPYLESIKKCSNLRSARDEELDNLFVINDMNYSIQSYSRQYDSQRMLFLKVKKNCLLINKKVTVLKNTKSELTDVKKDLNIDLYFDQYNNAEKEVEEQETTLKNNPYCNLLHYLKSLSRSDLNTIISLAKSRNDATAETELLKNLSRQEVQIWLQEQDLNLPLEEIEIFDIQTFYTPERFSALSEYILAVIALVDLKNNIDELFNHINLTEARVEKESEDFFLENYRCLVKKHENFKNQIEKDLLDGMDHIKILKEAHETFSEQTEKLNLVVTSIQINERKKDDVETDELIKALEKQLYSLQKQLNVLKQDEREDAIYLALTSLTSFKEETNFIISKLLALESKECNENWNQNLIAVKNKYKQYLSIETANETEGNNFLSFEEFRSLNSQVDEYLKQYMRIATAICAAEKKLEKATNHFKKIQKIRKEQEDQEKLHQEIINSRQKIVESMCDLQASLQCYHNYYDQWCQKFSSGQSNLQENLPTLSICLASSDINCLLTRIDQYNETNHSSIEFSIKEDKKNLESSLEKYQQERKELSEKLTAYIEQHIQEIKLFLQYCSVDQKEEIVQKGKKETVEHLEHCDVCIESIQVLIDRCLDLKKLVEYHYQVDSLSVSEEMQYKLTDLNDELDLYKQYCFLKKLLLMRALTKLNEDSIAPISLDESTEAGLHEAKRVEGLLSKLKKYKIDYETVSQQLEELENTLNIISIYSDLNSENKANTYFSKAFCWIDQYKCETKNIKNKRNELLKIVSNLLLQFLTNNVKHLGENQLSAISEQLNCSWSEIQLQSNLSKESDYFEVKLSLDKNEFTIPITQLNELPTPIRYLLDHLNEQHVAYSWQDLSCKANELVSHLELLKQRTTSLLKITPYHKALTNLSMQAINATSLALTICEWIGHIEHDTNTVNEVLNFQSLINQADKFYDELSAQLNNLESKTTELYVHHEANFNHFHLMRMNITSTTFFLKKTIDSLQSIMTCYQQSLNALTSQKKSSTIQQSQVSFWIPTAEINADNTVNVPTFVYSYLNK